MFSLPVAAPAVSSSTPLSGVCLSGRAGTAQWESASKGRGFDSRPENFLARVKFLYRFSVWCPFHLRVAAVARKKIPVILPKVQVAGNSEADMCMRLRIRWRCKLVRGLWRRKERAHTRSDDSSFTWHQPSNNLATLYVHRYGG